jgi:hypothetical protein
MRKLKEKQCENCGTSYTPTGSCSKYCIECKPAMRRQLARRGNSTYRSKNGHVVGVGRGSTTGRGKDNHMWSTGISVFINNRAKIKEERRYCEDCGKDLLQATHYHWVIHHRDHNSYNNPEDGSNWKLLCKKCHQVEHKCWLALEGATTILVRLPNGRYANPNRSSTQESAKRETP